jgi:hypothetical protein
MEKYVRGLDGKVAIVTGGRQSAKDGKYDGRGIVGLPIDAFQERRTPDFHKYVQ